MITCTFRHLPGVGATFEKRLWRGGCLTWQDVAAALEDIPRRRGGADALAAGIADSHERLAAGDAAWFGRRLGAADQWRLFAAFRHQAAYVDIETTGLGWPESHITTIALWDGRQLRTYRHGDNLEAFADDIRAYRLLVTFNGRGFDAPFIERTFRRKLDMAHLDLRWVMKPLGHTGGLKRMERVLGLERGRLAGVDGHTAVRLWRLWRSSGDARALETLLAYNAEDVLTLEPLAVFAYNTHLEQIAPEGGHAHQLAGPAQARTRATTVRTRGGLPFTPPERCCHAPAPARPPALPVRPLPSCHRAANPFRACAEVLRKVGAPGA